MDLNGIAKAVKQSTMVLRVSSMIIRGYLLFVFPACQRWLRAQRALSYSVTELKYNHVTEFLFPRFFVVVVFFYGSRLVCVWSGPAAGAPSAGSEDLMASLPPTFFFLMAFGSVEMHFLRSLRLFLHIFLFPFFVVVVVVVAPLSLPRVCAARAVRHTCLSVK